MGKPIFEWYDVLRLLGKNASICDTCKRVSIKDGRNCNTCLIKIGIQAHLVLPKGDIYGKKIYQKTNSTNK